MNATLEMEIVPLVDAKLIKYAGETGLEKPATETLVEAFRPVFAKSRAALANAKGVAESVKDATCVTEIKKSRACRLAIRAVRLESDETRKKHKQHALLYGRAVDGFHNILLADLAPVETALQEAEDVAERAEAARKAALKAEREAELAPFLDSSLMGDLSILTEEQFQTALSERKLLRQAKIDAAAKAKADAEARVEAERIERERIVADNAALKRAADALEMAAKKAARMAEVEYNRIEAERAEERRLAKLEADRIQEVARIEREAGAAKAKAEREATAKKLNDEKGKTDAAWRAAAALKAELATKEKAEADAKAKLEDERRVAEKAAQAAEAALDVHKVAAFIAALRALPLPVFRDKALGLEVARRIEEMTKWLEELMT